MHRNNNPASSIINKIFGTHGINFIISLYLFIHFFFQKINTAANYEQTKGIKWSTIKCAAHWQKQMMSVLFILLYTMFFFLFSGDVWLVWILQLTYFILCRYLNFCFCKLKCLLIWYVLRRINKQMDEMLFEWSQLKSKKCTADERIRRKLW